LTIYKNTTALAAGFAAIPSFANVFPGKDTSSSAKGGHRLQQKENSLITKPKLLPLIFHQQEKMQEQQTRNMAG
jgi:hypothetical protein